MNYSVDTLKKAAFHDELENVLKVLVAEDPLKVLAVGFFWIAVLVQKALTKG